MIHNKLNAMIILVLAGGGLSACGGGGGSSSSSTPAVVSTSSSVGTITGFGSIFVNGIEFETGQADYRVDDQDAFDDSALAIGMKVKVIGSVNTDGVTGIAEKITYDDEVEGPIDAGSLTRVDADNLTFTVLGLPVRAHASGTVYDDGAAFDTLAEGQIVEISGYFDGVEVSASRIERKNDNGEHFQLKGTVSAYDGSSITLSLLNGSSAGPFDIDAGAELDIGGDPVGRFVELKLAHSSAQLVAVAIESDDGNLPDDDEDEVHMRGILASDGEGRLLINGLPLRINDSTEFSPRNLKDELLAGREVRIEGEMKNGVLYADDIEANDGDIEIRARVTDIQLSGAKSGILSLAVGSGTLVVHTDNSALFEDDSDADLNDDRSFDLRELAIGSDFVDIEAYRDDAGKLIAIGIKREGEQQKTRLKAPLNAFESGSSVTMLGIDFSIGSATVFEADGRDRMGVLDFFGALRNGDMIKVEDRDGDGTADAIELDD